MFHDSIEQALKKHSEATHVLTTGDNWLEKGHAERTVGKFVAVQDTGKHYVILHNVDNSKRTINYDYDWVIAFTNNETKTNH